jgi:hypothetical protein
MRDGCGRRGTEQLDVWRRLGHADTLDLVSSGFNSAAVVRQHGRRSFVNGNVSTLPDIHPRIQTVDAPLSGSDRPTFQRLTSTR